MNKILRMDCGCIFECDSLDRPLMPQKLESLRQDCPKTWDLIKSGNTVGCFQIESRLGRQVSKKVAPDDISELADVGALLRPSVLEAKLEDGKNIMEHYAMRKHGKEMNSTIHASLEDVLKSTKGLLCIHENTLVSMANGEEKFIKDIKPGDMLSSINQNGYKYQIETCVDICQSPKTSGVEIILQNGYKINLTSDHKIYTLRGPVKVSELLKDDVIQVAKRQENANIKNPPKGTKTGSFPKKNIENIIKHSGLSCVEFCKKNNIGYSSLFRKSDFVSMSTALKSGIDLGDIVTMKVKKITPTHNQKYYSISVSNTHNLIGNGIVISNCYQEQVIRIGQEIAGMSESEADTLLRKGVAKKIPEIIARAEKEFVEGAVKVGKVNRETAQQIFDWIKKGARYGFNKSVVPNVIVESEDGTIKELKNIKIGEKINTPEGYSEVLNIFDHGYQPVYEIELENGYKIECTLDHKFLCEDGKIRELHAIIAENHKIMTT